MTTTAKTPSGKPLAPLSQQQITDALHAMLRQHAQSKPPRGGFAPTQTQRNADLVQALQHAQRNL